jgi:hypothetical protein
MAEDHSAFDVPPPDPELAAWLHHETSFDRTARPAGRRSADPLALRGGARKATTSGWPLASAA